MLATLRDWWQTGRNDTGASRAETISLVPERVSLLEAKRIARANEPGDGSPQVSVVDAVESVPHGRTGSVAPVGDTLNDYLIDCATVSDIAPSGFSEFQRYRCMPAQVR
jgi:hypothetical protein